MESYYYKKFRAEEEPPPETFYEKVCSFIPKEAELPPFMDEAPLKKVLREALITARPNAVVSLGVYSFMFFLFLSLLALNILPPSDIVSGIALLMPFILAGVVMFYPYWRMGTVRMGILGQSPLAVLYLVISLRVSPSLEKAVSFASKSVPDPIGKEFKLMMWEVQMKIHLDMKEALLVYSRRVKEWAPGFSNALYLVANSPDEPSDELRVRTLEKSIKLSLDNTKLKMEGFARGLGLPVAITNAMGVLLPVLGLVMAPVASIFIAKGSVAVPLTVIYDFFLPFVMILIVVYILNARPGGFSKIDLKDYPEIAPQGKYRLEMGKGKTLDIPAFLPALGVFLLLSSVTFMAIFASGGRILSPEIPQGATTGGSALITLPLIVAFGIAVGAYFYLSSVQKLELRSRISSMEQEFSSALFQLGNILDQGKPMEEAFQRAGQDLKGTTTADFFDKTISNLTTGGMPLEMAIFDEKFGSIKSFPSSMVKNIMAVIVESANEGPRVAAVTTLSISNYLKNLQSVQNKVEDVLSEHVAAMQFQSLFLIPLISGVVVGLSQLITSIILKIAVEVESVFAGGALQSYSGSFIDSMINIQGTIQASFLQLVVGFYTVILLVIMGYFVGGLKYGIDDKIGIEETLGTTLMVGSLLYGLVTAVVALIFGALSATMLV